MFLKRQDHRIGFIGGFILAGLTLAAGISVYVVMQRQAESLLSKSIVSLLQSNQRLFQSGIEQSLLNTQTVASRPFLIQNLQWLALKPDKATGLVALQRFAGTYPLSVFTGLSFYDVRGHEVARAGHFSQKHDLRVPLKSNHRAFLLWDGQFILQASSDVLDQQGRPIGMVKTEANLPLLSEAFADTVSIGKTGEFAVCAPLTDDEKTMDCFLSRVSGKGFKRLARVVEGTPLPMNYALNGETSIIFARDYRREQVVAAYAPVGALGLGMVIKINQEELYQPVTAKLKFVVPLLAALVLAGMLLLNFLVRPLVRKLVDSERATRGANILLRDSEARFANIVNLATDAIISVDEEQRILIFNCGAERIFGYTAAEMLGQTLDKLLPQRYAEVHRQHLRQFAAESQTARHMNRRPDIFGRRKDGSEFFAEASISRAMENARQVFTVSLRDISARRQAEEEIRQLNVNLEQRVLERTTELQAANRELEAFSYSVSHDLRAPLRAIDGFSQAVLEDYADKLDDQARDYLNRVRGATQRMGHLIDDMLALARVTRAGMRRGTVDLSALAADVIAELQKSEPARKVDWHIESGLVAQGDAQLLRVALGNLLGNAWKFTGKTASAKIEFGTLRNVGGAADFFVRDNGAGYDMTYADKLFGAFQRLHLISEFPGTGIGLATVQRIVHRHGGRVWAEGAVGKGATFYFTL